MLDSLGDMYGSIVDQDAADHTGSRTRFSITSPKGLEFVGYSRGVPPVGGGSVESFELVFFSRGASAPPLRIVANVSLAAALLAGAKTPESAAARVLSEFGL